MKSSPYLTVYPALERTMCKECFENLTLMVDIESNRNVLTHSVTCLINLCEWTSKEGQGLIVIKSSLELLEKISWRSMTAHVLKWKGIQKNASDIDSHDKILLFCLIVQIKFNLKIMHIYLYPTMSCFYIQNLGIQCDYQE